MGAPRKYELSPKRISPAARTKLRRHIERAQKDNDLRTWKRARAVLAYVEGQLATDIGPELQVDPSTVSRWVAAYAMRGLPALSPGKSTGAQPKLSQEQLQELGALVESGPVAAGFDCGIWTGRLVGELIRRRFGVEYHWKYVPDLLHKLGFSVQRPRKRLSRADLQAQEFWLRKTFPALKKKAKRQKATILFEDEASFQLDPTLHQTWSRVGSQPRVSTRGERKTVHVYGALALEDARFHFAFADTFNGYTFLGFLQRLVKNHKNKIHLIIDNGPHHNLDAEGKVWLQANRHRIELHRLPPYSPELNAIEGVWKTTRRTATHNRYFDTPDERDTALINGFVSFQRNPDLLDGHVTRFRT